MITSHRVDLRSTHAGLFAASFAPAERNDLRLSARSVSSTGAVNKKAMESTLRDRRVVYTVACRSDKVIHSSLVIVSRMVVRRSCVRKVMCHSNGPYELTEGLIVLMKL